jgi:hypothetical protein
VLVLSRTLLHTLLCSCLVFVVVDSTEGKWMNEKKTRERDERNKRAVTAVSVKWE